MKRITLVLLLLVVILFSVRAQEYSFKYGKITNDELNMSVYDKDTTASAVVIYDMGNTYYSVSNDRFQVCTDYKKKIKILKTTGLDEANVNIPFYYKSSSSREMITGLEAFSYNVENGKTVKTKLEKNYIFNEVINDKYQRIKFSVPNVKVGSVIEIKFSKTSDLVYNLDPWGIQGDIPVVFSSYEVKIPDYFVYTVETKGYEKIDVAENSEGQQFVLTGGGTNNTVNCSSRHIVFTAKDVPALKDEKNVWCLNDFLSGVRFELKATNFPGEYYRPYSRTWEELEALIKNETDFGSNMKMSNPFKEIMAKELASVTDEKEKITKIYALLKGLISWNEKYSFYGNKAKEAVKLKTGDNGQINMILLSMLRDAKIKAYPVLLSRRSLGRLPYSYPSFDQLNTFVVAAQTSDGKVHYMDGSAIHGGLNMLPLDFLVDRARILDEGSTEKWADLTSIGKNQRIRQINVKMNDVGNLSGFMNTAYTYQDAYQYKQKFEAAKDSAEFVESLANENHIVVDSFKLEDKQQMSIMLNEKLFFTKENENSGEFIYLNPMIFMHLAENEFLNPERKLPVEFPYSTSYIVNCNITLPENFQVVEMPKSVKMVLNDKCKCVYMVQQNANTITLSYKFDMHQILFPVDNYKDIREFFGQVVTKNHEMLVLKKGTTK